MGEKCCSSYTRYNDRDRQIHDMERNSAINPAIIRKRKETYCILTQNHVKMVNSAAPDLALWEGG